jgi:predicted alpha/beta-fold hydrolase
MPFIQDTTFKPPFLLRNRHVNTLYRHYFNTIKVKFDRHRMQTRDDDFLDLDVSSVNSDKVVILIHGLEGSSDSNYIHSLTHVLNKNNMDAIAINLRGCSGEPNKTFVTYHSGKTDDLMDVVNHVTLHYDYKEIHIVGFSLGGNITLKFMGEFVHDMPEIIKTAVAVSAPCDLKGSCESMSKRENKMYMKDFLKTLKIKALEKIRRFPNSKLDKSKILQIKNFCDFDDHFTAICNDFIDANDYYKKSSSKPFIKFIEKPTLLISAHDDPFLSESCLPKEEAQNSQIFTFLQTERGGHLGFVAHFKISKSYWFENQIVLFINENS